MQSTTLASTEQMHHLPSFPVPLIRTSCVAVTFATGVDHAHLSRLVKKCAFQSKGARSALSEDLPAMGEGGHGYSPVLPHRAVSVSDDDLGQFGIGTSSYSPRPSEVSTMEVEREWHTLEAWASGQKEHTFRSSVLYLDDTTDNSYAPMCIVNGMEGEGRGGGEVFWGVWFDYSSLFFFFPLFFFSPSLSCRAYCC